MTRCAHCRHDYAVQGTLCHLCHFWRTYFTDGDNDPCV